MVRVYLLYCVMYNYLRGTIAGIENGLLTLDIGGVGYLINASRALEDSVAVGEVSTAFVYLDIKETAHTLFGFATIMERELFVTLLGVGGVGSKIALSLLSVGASSLIHAIASGNSHVLGAVRGVSSKLGEKIVLELKSKILKKFTITEEIERAEKATPSSETQDALFGLIGLGMNRNKAEQAIANIDTAGKTAEEIITLALRGIK